MGSNNLFSGEVIMGDNSRRTVLALVDDRVTRIIWMLRQLPLETAAAYLNTVSRQTDRLGLLSTADQERIAELLALIGHSHVDKAA